MSGVGSGVAVVGSSTGFGMGSGVSSGLYVSLSPCVGLSIFSG